MKFKINWRELEKGQALVEYWPTLPAAVAVMIGAGILVGFVNSTFLKTANSLEGYCNTQEEITETEAEMHNHKIEVVGSSYDPNTDRTTVAYKVTSGPQPSISHWTLGLPKAVADRVIQSSEAWEWTDSDPTTGAVGMKFDIGYEAGGGGGNEGGGNDGGNNGGNDGDNNGKGGKGGKNRVGAMTNFVFKASALANVSGTDTRIISLTLDGNFEFGSVTVTTKAGASQVGTGTVSGPIELIEEDNNNGDDSTVDRSAGCQ